MTVIVTGAAGFIGFHVAQRLLDRGERVVGVDAFNDYYDPALKAARAGLLERWPGFTMIRADIADNTAFKTLVCESGAKRIVHLAAQAGVRHSIDNPFVYQHSNLAGHLSVLEAARHCGVDHLVYASSSSVYGDRPYSLDAGKGFKETDPVDAPVSLYAATKRADELMSISYAKLYGFPMSALRFFTVYGPWGRPDMAYFSFTQKILSGQTIEVFGEGQMARDFTYIDDIVDGVVGVLDNPPLSGAHEIYNIGDNTPVGLMEMISTLETALGREAAKVIRPMQPGDVTATYADIAKLKALTGYQPKVRLAEGLGRFADWYRSFYPG